MEYHNPILSGFHPDPSICRGEDRYYLVTSSFEFFPGLPLYESFDLVHWQPIGHCITRKEQMTFTDRMPNALGLYAPTIRHIDGRYYVICTNVGTTAHGPGNFFVWADDPQGPWSAPIWLDLPGIDPSLLQDEQHRVWYCGADQGIYLCQLNLADGSHGPRIDIWTGTGGADPEGPHLYLKDNWYYLMIAEGGTGYGHMVTMARSRDITGPYEACPNNPVLTNRSLPLSIQGTGHADLIEDENGNWWAVCLGIRPLEEFPKRHLLGRETFLVPVVWEADWPKFGVNGSVLPVMEGPLPGKPTEESLRPVFAKFTENFLEAPLTAIWNTLFRPCEKHIFLTKSGLALLSSEHISPTMETWIGHRLQHLPFTAEAVFDTSETLAGVTFGMTLYLNPTHRYDVIGKKTANGCLIKVLGQLGLFQHSEEFFEVVGNLVTLRLTGDTKKVTFFAQDQSGNWQSLTKLPIHYLTTETGGIFTGPYIGLFAKDKSSKENRVYCQSYQYEGGFVF